MKGKLAQLPDDLASLSISFNYFTDVISFQKILESPLEKKVSSSLSTPAGFAEYLALRFVDGCATSAHDAHNMQHTLCQAPVVSSQLAAVPTAGTPMFCSKPTNAASVLSTVGVCRLVSTMALLATSSSSTLLMTSTCPSWIHMRLPCLSRSSGNTLAGATGLTGASSPKRTSTTPSELPASCRLRCPQLTCTSLPHRTEGQQSAASLYAQRQHWATCQ